MFVEIKLVYSHFWLVGLYMSIGVTILGILSHKQFLRWAVLVFAKLGWFELCFVELDYFFIGCNSKDVVLAGV